MTTRLSWRFKEEGVLDLFLGGQGVFGPGLLPLGEHGGLVAGEQGALVELGADLAVELADGPSAAQGFGFVEEACLGLLDREQPDVVGPGEGKRGREVGAGGGMPCANWSDGV